MSENLQLTIRISSGILDNSIRIGFFKKILGTKWNNEDNLLISDIMESDTYVKTILLNEGYFYFGFLDKVEKDDFEVIIEAKDLHTNKIINEYEGGIDISPYMYFYVDLAGQVTDAMTKTKSFTVYGHLETDNLVLGEESSIKIIGTIIVKNNITFTGINSFIDIQKDGTLLQLQDNAIIDNSLKFPKLQRDSRIDIKELKLTTVDKTSKIKIKIEDDEPYVFVVPDIIIPDSDTDDDTEDYTDNSNNDDTDNGNNDDNDTNDSDDLIPSIVINELNIKPTKKKNTKEDIKNKGKVVVVFPPKIKIEFKVLNFN